MRNKLFLPFLLTLILFQTSCSLHSGSTYDRTEMGQPQSFSKGVIISVRDVEVKGTESGVGVAAGAAAGGLAGSQIGGDSTTHWIGAIFGAVFGGLIGSQAEEVVMQDNASEFLVQPDVGEPFAFVQVNEEDLKARERVLIINSDKMRIVRDQSAVK